MQQYYDKGDIQLYLGDCIEILEKAAPESVDMIFADPPKEGKKRNTDSNNNENNNDNSNDFNDTENQEVNETERKPVTKIVLGKGREVEIVSNKTSFWDASGKPISAKAFIEKLFNSLPNFFSSEEKLREI